MCQRQLDYFKKALISWREQVSSEIEESVKSLQSDTVSLPDFADRAARTENLNVELKTNDRKQKLIRKINSAIKKIDSKDYGYCEDCGSEIGIRRLETRLTATQCIDCKTVAELREKQLRGKYNS